MTTEALKSLSVTNLDAIPVVENTTGEGGVGSLRAINDYVTVSGTMAAGSTYRLVRLPTNAKLKALVFASEAQGAGKFQLGLYYSDSTTDGTAISNQGSVVPNMVAMFASDIDCASAVSPTNEIMQSGTYTLDLFNKPLWKAAALTSDPGGNFDIVATVHTTAVTTGTGRLGVDAHFVQ